MRREEKDCKEARNHGEGLNVTERKIVDRLDAFLPERLWDLPDPTTKVELQDVVRWIRNTSNICSVDTP